MRTFLMPVSLAVLAAAGPVWMLLLLLSGPTTVVDYNGGSSTVACHSVVDAASTPRAPFPTADQDSAVYHDDSGDTHADDNRTVLGWCEHARTARTGYAALLAVPTAVLGALAVRRRRPQRA